MPTPTDTLADEIRETNHQLADTNKVVRELSGKFDQFRVDVTREFGSLRVEMASLRTDMAAQFGTLNANLEGFRGRTETSLAVATWTVRIAVPILATVLIGMIVSSYSGFERLVKLEASTAHLETSTTKLEASTANLKTSVTKLEASIVEMREHSKEVDQRISRIVELMAAPHAPATTPKPH